MKSFTLVETLITIAVFSLIIVGITTAIIGLYRIHSYEWQQSLAIEEARQGLEKMIREIREMKPGEDGSFPIELAGDKEFIFYSDIDQDDEVERVRYFLASEHSGSETKTCVTFSKGGSCSVNFSDFLQGTIKSAQLEISVEGDFAAPNEYADIYIDGEAIDLICRSGCNDCAGVWQGTNTFDVTSQAEDNNLQVSLDASWRVDPFCDWQEPNHSMIVSLKLDWSEEVPSMEHQLKKGVIQPSGNPGNMYPLDQEEVSIISSYVRNSPPIFEYYDGQGNKIEDYPSKLKDTKLMKVFLVVNVDSSRPPDDFEIESGVQLRNLK